jgi:hypothetical protein
MDGGCVKLSGLTPLKFYFRKDGVEKVKVMQSQDFYLHKTSWCGDFPRNKESSTPVV